MSTVTLAPALPAQTTLTSGEHCSGPARQVGQQVRIQVPGGFAVFTITEAEASPLTVRLGTDAQGRLGKPTLPLSASLVTPIPDANQTPAQAQAVGGGAEVTVSGSKYLVLAPHGGSVEAGTDAQALTAAGILKGAGWAFYGYGAGSYARWHITSTELYPASWPRLQALLNVCRQYSYAVAFHGFSSSGILIGGSAPLYLKQKVQAALQGAAPGQIVSIAVAGASYSGDSSRNLVNRFAKYGIQIEQSMAARQTYGNAIAQAVAGILLAQP